MQKLKDLQEQATYRGYLFSRTQETYRRCLHNRYDNTYCCPHTDCQKSISYRRFQWPQVVGMLPVYRFAGRRSKKSQIAAVSLQRILFPWFWKRLNSPPACEGNVWLKTGSPCTMNDEYPLRYWCRRKRSLMEWGVVTGFLWPIRKKNGAAIIIQFGKFT